MKFVRAVAVGFVMLLFDTALAVVAPAELWKLQGLRFRLESIARAASPTPAGEPASIESKPAGPETVEPAPEKGKKRKTSSPQPSKKAPVLPDVLADGSDLKSDSADRQLLDELAIPVGDARYVADWAKSLSPLAGALAWHNGVIENLYFYGPQSDPFIKLVRFVFHAPPDSHELSVSVPEAGSRRALRTLIGSPVFGSVVRAALIRPSKGIDWGNPATKAQLTEDLNRRLSRYMAAVDEGMRADVPAIIMDLGEQIANARKSTIFPKYFIGLVLSAAWYWCAQADKLDAVPADQAVTRAEAPSQALHTLLDGFVHEASPVARERALVTAVPAWPSSENKTIATLSWLAFSPYPPSILQSWHMKCKFDRSQPFPDCGENTLHNLFDFLLFDPLAPKIYRFEYLDRPDIKPHLDLQKFYQNHSAVDQSMREGVCQEWADLVSGVPGVNYGLVAGSGDQRGGCDISPTPDAMLKVVRYLLGLKDEPVPGQQVKEHTWQELGALLSTPERRVVVEQSADSADVAIKINSGGLEREIKLHMTSGHAGASFPRAAESVPESVKMAITEPLAQLLLIPDKQQLDLEHARFKIFEIYAQPFKRMDDFDHQVDLLFALLFVWRDEALMKAYAGHWFWATGTKWLEVPDDAPRRILRFAWQQIVERGRLAAPAREFIKFVGEHECLHRAYVYALKSRASYNFDEFKKTYAVILDEAERAHVDLTPLLLNFVREERSDEHAARIVETITKNMLANPAGLLRYAGQIMQHVRPGGFTADAHGIDFAKRITPCLRAVVPLLAFSSQLADFLTDLASCYGLDVELRRFVILWIKDNIDKIITLDRPDWRKYAPLLFYIPMSADAAMATDLHAALQAVISASGFEPELVARYVEHFGRDDDGRRVVDWLKANVAKIAALVHEQTLSPLPLELFFARARQHTIIDKKTLDDLAQALLADVKITPDLAAKYLSMVQQGQQQYEEVALGLARVLANADEIIRFVGAGQVRVFDLLEFFTEVQVGDKASMAELRRFLKNALSKLTITADLAVECVRTARIAHEPELREEALAWLKNNTAAAAESFVHASARAVAELTMPFEGQSLADLHGFDVILNFLCAVVGASSEIFLPQYLVTAAKAKDVIVRVAVIEEVAHSAGKLDAREQAVPLANFFNHFRSDDESEVGAAQGFLRALWHASTPLAENLARLCFELAGRNGPLSETAFACLTERIGDVFGAVPMKITDFAIFIMDLRPQRETQITLACDFLHAFLSKVAPEVSVYVGFYAAMAAQEKSLRSLAFDWLEQHAQEIREREAYLEELLSVAAHICVQVPASFDYVLIEKILAPMAPNEQLKEFFTKLTTEATDPHVRDVATAWLKKVGVAIPEGAQ